MGMISEVQSQVPDGVFYYSLSIILVGALIGIIYRYSEKTSKLLHELVKNDVRQDAKLETHSMQIAELKKQRTR